MGREGGERFRRSLIVFFGISFLIRGCACFWCCVVVGGGGGERARVVAWEGISLYHRGLSRLAGGEPPPARE